jgi:hypothetical protein
MSNFLSVKSNRFSFYLKNILTDIFILFFPFLIMAIAKNTTLILPSTFVKIITLVLYIIKYGSFVFVVIHLFKLGVLYNKETEYQTLKDMFESGKNEFVRSFQGVFTKFLLPIFFLVFSMNLFFLKNIFVHLIALLFIFVVFFVYINIKLVDIVLAKKMNLRF